MSATMGRELRTSMVRLVGKAWRFGRQPVVVLRDVVEPVSSRVVGDGVLFIAGNRIAQVDLGARHDGAGGILYNTRHSSAVNGLSGEGWMSNRGAREIQRRAGLVVS